MKYLTNDEMIVTPWEVSGEINYSKLIEQFGTQPLHNKLLSRIKKHSGELHIQLRRGVFFSHRDFDWLLDRYESGEKFILYTGRGPSGNVRRLEKLVCTMRPRAFFCHRLEAAELIFSIRPA